MCLSKLKQAELAMIWIQFSQRLLSKLQGSEQGLGLASDALWTRCWKWPSDSPLSVPPKLMESGITFVAPSPAGT